MGDMNCWDVLGCSVKETCAAYPHFGRDCFAVSGTLCRGKKQGNYREKIEERRACKFYLTVMGLGEDGLVRGKR